MKSIVCGLLLCAPALGAQTWIERGDAPNTPRRLPQRTLEEGPLEAIVGMTHSSAGDPRDAFCVRISDLGSFLATTDSEWASAAGAELDLRLSLFDSTGRELVASGGPSPRRQTLVGAAVDPAALPAAARSAGEYVLAVDGLQGAPGAYSLALRGAEGCGVVDVVLAVEDFALDRYCLGTCSPPAEFHCHGVSGETFETSGVALGHFDDDGQLDAILATRSTAEPNRICPGDGVGRFSFAECVAIGSAGTSSRDAATGDVDGDGNLDVVFADAGGQQTVCLGDGALSFACQPVDVVSSQGRGVALGDLDGDDVPDAVFADSTVNLPNRVCLGDGDGGFSCGDYGAEWISTGIKLGHFDDDTNLDAAISSLDGGKLCLGNGAGAFSCTEILSAGTTAVAAGLLNGDSHLDLVFTAEVIEFPRACLADGTGGFSCTIFGGGHTFGRMTGVALADFDGNGTLDAAFSAENEPGSFCFGDGAGSFSGCKALNEHQYLAQGIAAGALAPASVGHDDFETGDLRAWAFSEPEP
ncbi:MAG: VCBS repeat-containing protein [Acidobacteriota bacterium]|nr:VCBS repeat-containing protein [Acidobacteriota bacterium]MDH3523490.1 VCBS repeat-containing protein [Acidobacteriota bacterium]